MKNKKTIKNILIALVVAIALLVAYSMLSSKEDIVNSGGLSSRLGSSSIGQIEETDVVVANAEILKILGSIENIELNDDIFTNPIFRKLKDKSFTITRPNKIGRKNPFLPIGYGAIADSRQAGQSNIVSNLAGQEGGGFFDSVNNESSDYEQEI